jgi:hypothetical protein
MPPRLQKGAIEKDTRDIIAMLLGSSKNLYAGNLYEELRFEALALPILEPGSLLDYERQQLNQESPRWMSREVTGKEQRDIDMYGEMASMGYKVEQR